MTDIASYDGDERPLAGEYVLGVLDALVVLLRS